MTREDPSAPAPFSALAVPAAAFLVFAALHFALLYHPGLVRMDDFGYLQSTAETIIRGRPFTHDSLSPYSATMSALGAGVYALTGDFTWATWGLQALFAMAAFPLAYSLLRPRLRCIDASLLTLALATQPIYWYRCSEYSSNLFALVFIMAALWAYRKGAWFRFFLCAFLAFANRQNSLALMALPAWHLCFDRASDPASGSAPRRGLFAKPFPGLMAMGAACILLHLAMNGTQSRTGGIYAGWDLRQLLIIGRAVLQGAAMGLAFLSFLLLLRGGDPIAGFKKNLGRPALPSALSLAFLAPPLIARFTHREFHGFVEMHTPLLDSLDRGGLVQWTLGLAVPLLLWLLDWSRISPGAPLALFAAFIFITAARGFWYDFYLAEAGLAALFLFSSLGGPAPEPAAGSEPEPEPAKPWGRWVLIGLTAAHAAWGYGYRIRADKDMLRIRAYEKLEREKGLRPDRMTDAPWGYLGWKLYDVFAAREVPGAQRYFICYLLADQVVVDTGLPWRPGFRRGALPGGSPVLEEGEASIGFLKLPYRVADLSPPALSRLSPADAVPPAAKPIHSACFTPLEGQGYVPKPFPLDAGEWSALLKEGRRHFLRTGQSPFSGPFAPVRPPEAL